MPTSSRAAPSRWEERADTNNLATTSATEARARRPHGSTAGKSEEAATARVGGMGSEPRAGVGRAAAARPRRPRRPCVLGDSHAHPSARVCICAWGGEEHEGRPAPLVRQQIYFALIMFPNTPERIDESCCGDEPLVRTTGASTRRRQRRCHRVHPRAFTMARYFLPFRPAPTERRNCAQGRERVGASGEAACKERCRTQRNNNCAERRHGRNSGFARTMRMW